VIRFVLYLVFFYVVWRIVFGVFHVLVGPSGSHRPVGQRRHARDFSDVQEADFEDITPPKDEKNNPTSTSSS